MADMVKKWRKDMISRHSIIDVANLRLLEEACECQYRIAQARAEVARLGVLVVDKSGVPKANPACKIEHENANRFMACMKALRLTNAPAPATNQFDKFL